jgi:hypothetical protein
MTDYLSHLVARVLRTKPVLEPVVPSLFEPVGLAEVAMESEITADTVPRAVLLQSPVVRAGLQLMGDHTEPIIATPRVPVAESIVHTHEVVHEAQATAAAAPPISEAVIRQQTLELHERSFVEQHTRELRELFIEPRVPPAAPPAAWRSTVDVPRTQPRRDPRVASTAGRVHSRRLEGLPATSPASAEPEVRITIGRVDVRAVLPPTPADASRTTPSPRATQAMPLEDYLRQKDGGRR